MEAPVITTLKLAGLSAILSAGLVSGFSGPDGKLDAAPAKLFYDRADGSSPATVTLAAHDPRLHAAPDVNRDAKGHRVRPDIACTDGARLLAAADCVPNLDGAGAQASEVRSADRLSIVRRGPVATLALQGGTKAVVLR